MTVHYHVLSSYYAPDYVAGRMKLSKVLLSSTKPAECFPPSEGKRYITVTVIISEVSTMIEQCPGFYDSSDVEL